MSTTTPEPKPKPDPKKLVNAALDYLVHAQSCIEQLFPEQAAEYYNALNNKIQQSIKEQNELQDTLQQ